MFEILLHRADGREDSRVNAAHQLPYGSGQPCVARRRVRYHAQIERLVRIGWQVEGRSVRLRDMVTANVPRHADDLGALHSGAIRSIQEPFTGWVLARP